MFDGNSLGNIFTAWYKNFEDQGEEDVFIEQLKNYKEVKIQLKDCVENIDVEERDLIEEILGYLL